MLLFLGLFLYLIFVLYLLIIWTEDSIILFVKSAIIKVVFDE